MTKLGFDIPHPNKEGWRLSHVCLEGPFSDIYWRGKLINDNIIRLPEYWRGLIDPETITVILTPGGSYQELFVKSVEWGSRIVIGNSAGGNVDCHFVVHAERINDDKNVLEYEED